MKFFNSKSTLGITRALPYALDFLVRLDSLNVRIVDAAKEAFFPTRCLTCGSFYRVGKSFRNTLKSILKVLDCRDPSASIIEFFFKGDCLSDDMPENGSNAETGIFSILMAPFLCLECSGTFLAIESPICSTCGMVFRSRLGEDHICGACFNDPKSYQKARSAGIYDNVMMDAIHCLKYYGKIQLAKPLSLFLFFIFCRYWHGKFPDLIIPVPLHNKKLRRRGFNPSFFLVKEWASIIGASDNGFPVMPIAEDILLRTRRTKSQTGLGRKERLKNIKNAFAVNDPSRIHRKKILLIDDVYTTGATANECSKVLMAAGASHVDVLTLARAV